MDPSQIQVTSRLCGSLAINFFCLAASANADQALCQTIFDQASQYNSQLNLLLGVSVERPMGDGSHKSLYALFALLLFPIILMTRFTIWYRGKKREADEQYLQETEKMGLQKKSNAWRTFEAHLCLVDVNCSTD